MFGLMKHEKDKQQHREEESVGPVADLPLFQHPVFPLFGSVLSGLLLALCFPGYGQATLAYAALVPLMFAVQSASVKKAAGLGLLAGFVFFMVSLSWLSNLTQMVEGGGLKVSALAGYAILALYCALYFMPFTVTVALGVRKWVGFNLRKNIRFIFAVTMVWVGSEYLRGILFTGFPWNPVGVSQYSNPALIQVAEWGGVHLVSAFVVWMNAAVFITFRQYTHGTRTRQYRPHLELMAGLIPTALALTYGMNILFDPPRFSSTVRAALIQPNIEQTAKWDKQRDQEILTTLEELTDTASRLEGIDLIIWPETALPDFVRVDRASYDLVRRMTAKGIPLLAGTMDVSFTTNRPLHYNSSILFSTNGAEVAKYDKQHLVPFGEYVPFPGLMRKFTPIDVDFRSGRESTLFTLQDRPPFSALICFEDIVAPLAVKAVRGGARWLVTQSNDAWFDPSAQSEQHLAHAVFRCVENRIPMVRCCNTGVTCSINALGMVERNLAVRTAGFTIADIQARPRDAEQTFFTRHSDAFARICLAGGATVLFVLRAPGGLRRRKKGEAQ